MSEYSKSTSVIVDEIYPLIEKSLEKNSSKFISALGDFFNGNSSQIYDIAPYDIIYYKQTDIDNLYKSLGITQDQIIEIMQNCYYWKIAFSPIAAKEPYVIVLMMAIRYFLLKKKEKEAELTSVYLCFTGKFYASLFTGVVFPKAPPIKHKAAMDYVINNVLTDKFELKAQGSMFGAIKALCITWLGTYGTYLKGHPQDGGDNSSVANIIKQLRDREKSFMMNIAKIYYKNKDNYLNYETDNLSDEKEFRLTDNDSLKATRYTEDTINYLVNNSVSLQLCNKCKDVNIQATEVKDIMESIIGEKEYLDDLYRVVNILICDFIKNNPNKTVGSVDFIVYSLKMKPNTKDKYLLELKSILLNWLDKNSPNYRRRKSRIATAMSYYRAVLMYLVLAINYATR
jgi:hypothetical protein